MDILIANAMLILTLLILIISVIMGAVRGFIKTFFSAFAVLVALVIAVQAGPYVGKVIQHTPVYSGIAGQIEQNMNEQTNEIKRGRPRPLFRHPRRSWFQ